MGYYCLVSILALGDLDLFPTSGNDTLTSVNHLPDPSLPGPITLTPSFSLAHFDRFLIDCGCGHRTRTDTQSTEGLHRGFTFRKGEQ